MIERTHDVKLMVGPNGEVMLPADVLDQLGLDEGGGVIFITFGQDGARLETMSQRMRQAQRLIGAGRPAVDLLQDHRRTVAERERTRRGALA
jgi:bifunctional DNA-binding transcriptional regulator/antitoxin component of YhaV-PrlF toxin-antitoxin module